MVNIPLKSLHTHQNTTRYFTPSFVLSPLSVELSPSPSGTLSSASPSLLPPSLPPPSLPSHDGDVPRVSDAPLQQSAPEGMPEEEEVNEVTGRHIQLVLVARHTTHHVFTIFSSLLLLLL